ncbi:hypothetical protein JCM3765_004162 [Sporobolomyces pararoseus]
MSANPFDTIRTSFDDRLSESPTLSFSIQAGLLIGLSILIASLSCTLFVRLLKKTGRFWTIEQNGIFRFNVSMVAQLLCGIYAILQVVSLTGYLTKKYSFDSHIILQLLSPLILYLVFLIVLHSLVLQTFYNPLLRPFPDKPNSLSDDWEISQALKRRQQRTRSSKINLVSIFSIFVLLIAPFVATLAFIKEWTKLKDIIEESIEWANSVEATHSALSSVKFGELTAKGLDQERKLVVSGDLFAGFWISMLVIGLTIFVPAFIYFVKTLRQRRASLRRALIRLNSGSRCEVATFSDEASKTGIDNATLANEKQQELKERLSLTDRSIKKSYLRFFLTISILASYFSLLSWVLKHFYPDSHSLFTLTLWSSWSITPLSLVSSLIFAFQTFFARLPVLETRPTPKLPVSPPHYRSRIGQEGGDANSQRGLTSTFDAQSISSSTYTSNYPSAFHSRSSSFSANANLPSYDPISTHRPHVSYPPPPSQATSSIPLSRKKSQTTISSISRKAVPSMVDQAGGGAAAFQIGGDGDEEEEAQSSSHHGSIWKEELK